MRLSNSYESEVIVVPILKFYIIMDRLHEVSSTLVFLFWEETMDLKILKIYLKLLQSMYLKNICTYFLIFVKLGEITLQEFKLYASYKY